jgi:hypothetical protein
VKQKLHPQDIKRQKSKAPTQSAQQPTCATVSEPHSLMQIQQSVGNRVMQKEMAGTRGQISYPLSREVAAALSHEAGSRAPTPSAAPPLIVSSKPQITGPLGASVLAKTPQRCAAQGRTRPDRTVENPMIRPKVAFRTQRQDAQDFGDLPVASDQDRTYHYDLRVLPNQVGRVQSHSPRYQYPNN